MVFTIYCSKQRELTEWEYRIDICQNEPLEYDETYVLCFSFPVAYHQLGFRKQHRAIKVLHALSPHIRRGHNKKRPYDCTVKWLGPLKYRQPGFVWGFIQNLELHGKLFKGFFTEYIWAKSKTWAGFQQIRQSILV